MGGMTIGSAAVNYLGDASTTRERVACLVKVLDKNLVARAAKVSATAVHNWEKGTEPRTDAAMSIDDLRSIVAILLEGGFEPSRVRSWLISRNAEWLNERRPVDEVSRRPAMVLSAAHDAVVA